MKTYLQTVLKNNDQKIMQSRYLFSVPGSPFPSDHKTDWNLKG